MFAEYVLFALDREPTGTEMKALAAGLLTAIIIMHSCFLKTGIWIQNVLGWAKIGLAIVMILTSLFTVAFHETAHNSTVRQVPIMTRNRLWDGSVWNWGILSTAFFKVSYSYAGLSNVNSVLNEVKNPVRTLKTAASAALLTACILYLLINIAYFLVIPLEEIKNSGELIAALFFERVFGARVGRVLLPSAVAVSAAGNVMVVTFSHVRTTLASLDTRDIANELQARVIQEIARAGFLPFSRAISSSLPFNAPMAALITHYIPSLLVICIPAGKIYSFILDVEGYPAQFFSIAVSFGLIWLRYKRPDLHRPYKAYLFAVWFSLLFSVALLIAPFVPRKDINWREHLSQVTYAFVGTSV